MKELLTKIGVPTAIGTAISLTVVVVPMLFKIDERYAKQEALEAEVQKLEKQNAELRAELAQNAGFQQAMVAFIQQGRLPAPAAPAPAAPPPAPVAAAPLPAAAPAPPPAAAPAPPPAAAPAPTFNPENLPATAAGSPPKAAAKPPLAQEKPSNWRELNEGIRRQQERLTPR